MIHVSFEIKNMSIKQEVRNERQNCYHYRSKFWELVKQQPLNLQQKDIVLSWLAVIWKLSSAVQKEIIEITKNTNVDLMELDVSSFDSIRTFCTAFKSKYPRLDILIHNAAYLNHGEKEYKLSPEHIELSFATNTFGPFLMTRLLADHLAKSQDPRILNACTTNIKNFFDPKRKIEFDNLRGELTRHTAL